MSVSARAISSMNPLLYSFQKKRIVLHVEIFQNSMVRSKITSSSELFDQELYISQLRQSIRDFSRSHAKKLAEVSNCECTNQLVK